MRKYFRRIYPHVQGYTSHFEYEGEWVKRQIDLFLDTVLLLGECECSDVPLSEITYSPEEEISAEEFNALWEKHSAGPRGTTRRDSPLLKPPFFDPPADS